jgi:cytochrome c oxidase cbb3-type subunit I/II
MPVGMNHRCCDCIDLGCFGINMIGTILKRRERLYTLQFGFTLATGNGSCFTYFNSLLPVSAMKSYSVCKVQDALVQWW